MNTDIALRSNISMTWRIFSLQQRWTGWGFLRKRLGKWTTTTWAHRRPVTDQNISAVKWRWQPSSVLAALWQWIWQKPWCGSSRENALQSNTRSISKRPKCLGCKLNDTLPYNRILVFVRGRGPEHLQEMTFLMTSLSPTELQTNIILNRHSQDLAFCSEIKKNQMSILYMCAFHSKIKE